MSTPAPTDKVNRRYDFVLLFDVTDGNPNGDPDGGNMPRIDPQSQQGLVTDTCLKRKIRNAIAVLGKDDDNQVRTGYELYFQTQDATYEQRILNLQHQRAYQANNLGTGEKKGKGKEKSSETEAAAGDARTLASNTQTARQWMCENFYDVRAFGAVMTTGVNCGQVRGPVQLTFARSIDPILPLDISITRKSVTKVEEAEAQARKDGSITGTMGRKNLVPYSLYRCQGFVNPYLARDTGFTFADLGLLWDALKGLMWEIDRSASRGLMCTRGLYVFEHSSQLGNAPAHELFDRVRIAPLGPDAAPRQFDDYRSRLTIQVDGLPGGVTLHRMVG